ncbi:CATRA system-associated protein [Streptomyces glaucescens]
MRIKEVTRTGDATPLLTAQARAERDALWAESVGPDGSVGFTELGIMALYHWLCYTAQQYDGEADLRLALQMYEVLLPVAPETVPPQVQALLSEVPEPADPGEASDLAVGLFQQADDLHGIDRAMMVMRQALADTAADAQERPERLAKLGVMVRHRYEVTRRTGDLTEAVDLGRQAVADAPPGHPGRLAGVTHLALTLRLRHELTGSPADLAEATELAGEALVIMPPNHPERGGALFNLAVMLRAAEGRQEAAIALLTEAAALIPPHHTQYGSVLATLGGALLEHHVRSGSHDRADLDAALTKLEAARTKIPKEAPQRPQLLATLAVGYRLRFDLDGSVDDLDQEFTQLWELYERSGEKDKTLLPQIAMALSVRAAHTADLEERERYVEAVRAMKQFCGPEQEAVVAGHVGAALLSLYGDTDDLAHLDEAITLLRTAGEPEPLVMALRLRHTRTRQAYDLEEAVRLESGTARRSQPVSAGARAAIRKLLVEVMNWSLPPGGWLGVDGEIAVLQSALESGDRETADVAALRLSHMAPLRVGRLGEEPLPPPPPTRERLNRMVHALNADGDTERDGGGDDDEPA